MPVNQFELERAIAAAKRLREDCAENLRRFGFPQGPIARGLEPYDTILDVLNKVRNGG